jgi:c-di-GMP-related signal transduction protein
MAGMFSLLHIALEKTREELLTEIAVPDEIKTSLLTPDGIYSDLISFFGHYEYSNWDEVTRFSEQHGLSSERIYNSYIESVKWYNDLVQE